MKYGSSQQSDTRFMARFDLFMQQKGYRPKSIETYRQWVVRFIKFCHYQEESDFKVRDIERFLCYLVNECHVRPNSQKTALNSLVFLYKRFLNINVEDLSFSRSATAKKVPVVLNQQEACAILDSLTGFNLFIAQLMYGCGLRISEALNLRVQSVNRDDRTLTIFSGKGNKDRCVPIPEHLLSKLALQVSSSLSIHRDDINAGAGYVLIPGSGSLDIEKNFSRASALQYLFPSKHRQAHTTFGFQYRESYSISQFRRALKFAVTKSDIPKEVCSHTFRHSFATELLRKGVDIRTTQEILGHESIKTTEIYLHISLHNQKSFFSPVDLELRPNLTKGNY